MSYVVVCGWDGNGKSPSYRFEETEEAAQAAVDRIKSENPEVFYAARPVGEATWYVVDPVAKTVVVDEVTRDAERAQSLWVRQMKTTDATMTRVEEDMIDRLEEMLPGYKSGLPQDLQDKHAAKKTLRSNKP